MMDKRQHERWKRTEGPAGQAWPLCRRWIEQVCRRLCKPQELYIALLSEPYTNGTLIPHSDKGRGSSGHRSWPRPLCDCVPLFHSLRAGAHGTESSYHLKLHRLISNHPWGLPGVSVWPVWAPLPLREAFYSLHMLVL